MKQANTESKEKFLSQLEELYREKLEARLADDVMLFASQYFENLPVEEARGRRLEDIYGAVLSCWNFLNHHQVNQPKVEVFNPDLEENGWQSTHSVIAILHVNIPFLVDSIRLALNKAELTIHSIHHAVLQVERDRKGHLTKLLTRDEKLAKKKSDAKKGAGEAFVFVEIDRRNEAKALEGLRLELLQVLSEVRIAVDDYETMRQYALDSRKEIKKNKQFSSDDLTEATAFINWLADDHFTFLGYDEYEFTRRDNDIELRRIKGSELGILKSHNERPGTAYLSELPRKTREHLLKPDIFAFAKSAQRSRVHRPAYPDYVSIKKFDSDGNVIGERRFLGLYTATVYQQRHSEIPLIRAKTASVIERSGLDTNEYGRKELEQVLAVYPRDDLFQIDADELFRVAMGIMYIQERRKIRLFIREDAYAQFVSAMVFVPRDIYNTDLRLKMEHILCTELEAEDIEFTTHFSESVLARTQFNIRVKQKDDRVIDVDALQNKIVEAAQSWKDGFREALYEAHGEELANTYIHLYENAFPAAYREEFSPRRAVIDVDHMAEVNRDKPISMSFYRALEELDHTLHFKLFHPEEQLPLSDVLPIFENLGLKVIGEHPYEVKNRKGGVVWIHDFTLHSYAGRVIDIHRIRKIFEELFQKVLLGEAENDNFNLLLLGAHLNWRQIALIRAYARYMRQIRVSNSQEFIALTLAAHVPLTQMILTFFESKFYPDTFKSRSKSAASQQKIELEFNQGLDEVSNLSEDKILRLYIDLIKATLRTNFYQPDNAGQLKNYISLKFSPSDIPDMPLPMPMFEIFVYSNRIEGVHLRGGRVARGGLRWSDRYEDFRTEVLGLVKAQQVKNAVIVPVGAKGGFVAKQLPENDREAFLREGVESYKTFIRGLLDITDNVQEGAVIPPQSVIRHDEDDTYLVVAADKGTATFSDIANQLSAEYGFWLGDAFASGGSHGYDHKKMGITARGAWVSVERHFREMGVNTATTDFTVAGVGDMSGDVFGNGMLLSPHIKLVAAFNHLHIFVDPDPDAERSFAERQRLFELPRSTWDDFDKSLISKGGGVFSRASKSIALTPEVKALLGIKVDRVPPNMLISYILKAEVDLVWFGGIGTYVKAKAETDADVGDKANDNLRVNARDLRAKVIGEGGNLGMTQRARIEFALQGGRLNTDFIDNAGGVDCSDHEVNMKILLNEIVANGDLTEKQRNEMLAEMTDEVAALVLKNNYRQTLAISNASFDVAPRIEEYRRLISTYESSGKLNRELEFIPDDETILERKVLNLGLSRPELSVLISYVKGDLKESLNESALPDDDYLAREIEQVLPKMLVEKYSDQLKLHKLRREIVATQIANDMVNHMGITFVERLRQSTGASVGAISLAYIIARDVFRLEHWWTMIERLDYTVPSETQAEMMSELMRLIRRASRWLLRNRRSELNIAANMKKFEKGVNEIADNLSSYLIGDQLLEWQNKYDQYVAGGIDPGLAQIIAGATHLYSALGIIEAQELTSTTLPEVAYIYYSLGEQLDLGWFSSQINQMRPATHWQALARETFREDLDWQQRSLTVGVLRLKNAPKAANERLTHWLEYHSELVDRWSQMCTELKASKDPEFAMYSVALRELLDLAQSSTHATPGGQL